MTHTHTRSYIHTTLSHTHTHWPWKLNSVDNESHAVSDTRNEPLNCIVLFLYTLIRCTVVLPLQVMPVMFLYLPRAFPDMTLRVASIALSVRSPSGLGRLCHADCCFGDDVAYCIIHISWAFLDMLLSVHSGNTLHMSHWHWYTPPPPPTHTHTEWQARAHIHTRHTHWPDVTPTSHPHTNTHTHWSDVTHIDAHARAHWRAHTDTDDHVKTSVTARRTAVGETTESDKWASV